MAALVYRGFLEVGRAREELGLPGVTPVGRASTEACTGPRGIAEAVEKRLEVLTVCTGRTHGRTAR
jgi:hypothetical protein